MHIQRIIKIFLGIMLGVAIVLPAGAQNKDAYEMMVNGVKVIVQPSGNEIVEVLIILKGGVQNYPADKAGIEKLAMTALTECGTTKDDKNSFKNKLDKVSAEIDGTSEMDFSSLRLNCISSDLETVWPLYIDAFTSPLFDSKEFDRIKQDAINQLKSRASQPDESIDKLAKQTAYAGKDYSKDPNGTEETVSKLDAVETKAYYTSLLTRSRMLVVVVGEIDRGKLEKMIQTLTENIPQGNPFNVSRYNYIPEKNTFKSEKKELATNYIEGITGGPLPGTPDYNAYVLAVRIFSQRDFLEVRTNNGLSYAPYVVFNGGLSPSTAIFVSTTNPDKYKAVIDQLIDKTKKEGFTPKEVKNGKTTYITGFYYRMETNSAQATTLASNEILHNNWRRALTIKDDMEKVSVADVDRVFNKYINHITWVYQGDSAKVNPDLYSNAPAKTRMPDSRLKNEKK